MNVGRVVVLLAGVTILVLNAAGVIVVLIVPRTVSGPARIPLKTVRWAFSAVSSLFRNYTAKDRILALSEPVAMMVLLASWLAITVFGFTLVDWGLGTSPLDQAFTQSGSSVFTLGTSSDSHFGPSVISYSEAGLGLLIVALFITYFIAAASGLVLVALQIAYLPTLYSSYNRRETMVTLLQSRAGAPAWGPELLIRHQLVGLFDNLASLFGEWERWAADVAESHCRYPSLLFLRSPRAQNSWIVSLIAVMDAAAICLALDPEGAPVEARLVLRMGFTCLQDLAQITRTPYDPDPDPDDEIALPRPEFDAACARLAEIGYPGSRSVEEAWPHFRGWRVNYETIAYALASLVNAPPARWTGPRRMFPAETLEPDRPTDRTPTTGG